jgi:hypothetical protein
MDRALKWMTFGAALIACACSKDDKSETPPPSPEIGVFDAEGGWVFRTSNFTLGPGEERFLCYAADTPHDLAVKRFSVVGKPAIHHVVLVEAEGVKEPYGESVCDVLFKFSWRPMFVAGAGNAEINIPDGAARFVDTGSQVVLQLHLLNASDKPVTDFAEVRMDQSLETDADPVGLYVFGTTSLALPPKQPSTVQSTCEVKEDVNIFALMPHMHYLGRKLVLELGADEASLSPIYTRDPYDFDQQTIADLPLKISPGTLSRITCSYENDRDQVITFGESTTNEMCFGIGFATGPAIGDGLAGCFERPALPDGGGVPKDAAAGECGQHPVTETGVGRACTQGGTECGDLFCTAGQPGSEGTSGICVSMGCQTSAECGPGATCCNVAQGGGVDICIPEACRPEYCIPKP